MRRFITLFNLLLCFSNLFSQSNQNIYSTKSIFPDSCDNRVFQEIIRFNQEHDGLPTTLRVLDMSKISDCLFQKDSIVFITRDENVLEVDTYQKINSKPRKELVYIITALNDNSYNLIIKYGKNKLRQHSIKNKRQKLHIRLK